MPDGEGSLLSLIVGVIARGDAQELSSVYLPALVSGVIVGDFEVGERAAICFYIFNGLLGVPRHALAIRHTIYIYAATFHEVDGEPTISALQRQGLIVILAEDSDVIMTAIGGDGVAVR